MKIYTKGGDQGETSLFTGQRVPKTHLRLQTYGTLDELNTIIGLVRSKNAHPDIEQHCCQLQILLFILCSDLATPLPAPDQPDAVERVSSKHITYLEQAIDMLTVELPPLDCFILPGGTEVAALLHLARTVCRRAERWLVALAGTENLGPHVLVLVNRTSDYIFTLARYANFTAGMKDEVLDREFPEINPH